ncbi:MAG: zinc/iron permease [Bacillales bacterium]|jgi:ZIP family zinc transporter|nr:zinc/iron permease [Bacillales bacterium]
MKNKSKFGLEFGMVITLSTVLITAFVVGGSTFVGSLFAFIVKQISHKTSDMVLSFAAGIMLGATFFSLILPAVEDSGRNYWLPCAGIFAGALLINALDRFVPHVHSYIKVDHDKKESLNKVILFLIAIAIHNFPEGIAVGVSFGSGNSNNAYAVAFGISVQNILEGLITILPLISAGVEKKKAVMIAFATGLTEVIGVIIGYAMASSITLMLPFTLALAGGTMLFVISHDMIPETHSHGFEKIATYSLIIGFITMIIVDGIL